MAEIQSDMTILLDYLWHSEEKHYQESPMRNHIFQVIKRLAKKINFKPKE